MGLGVAAGHNQFSGTYTPEVWSGKILVKFYNRTIFTEIANTKYKGDIARQGDKVYIRNTPTVSIKDHKKGQPIVHEHLQTDIITLDIDKAKSWAFVADDIDTFQSDIDYVEDWTRDAAKQMQISIDSEVLGDIYDDAHASNQGATAGVLSQAYNMGVSGTPLQITSSNIIQKIIEMGNILDEQNVPEEGRYLLLPPIMCGLIKQSDLNKANEAGDATSMRRHGNLGMIDRFTIYRTNQLATTVDGANTVTNVIAGQMEALTFATQLTKSRAKEAENLFGMKYDGLQVYGYKVIKPEALVWGYWYV